MCQSSYHPVSFNLVSFWQASLLTLFLNEWPKFGSIGPQFSSIHFPEPRKNQLCFWRWSRQTEREKTGLTWWWSQSMGNVAKGNRTNEFGRTQAFMYKGLDCQSVCIVLWCIPTKSALCDRFQTGEGNNFCAELLIPEIYIWTESYLSLEFDANFQQKSSPNIEIDIFQSI